MTAIRLFSFLACGALCALSLLDGQSQSSPTISRGFATPYPKAAALDSPSRQLINDRWNNPSTTNVLSDDSERRIFDYPSSALYATRLSSASQQKVTLVGSVSGGRSYLSSDHTTIYTEVLISIKDVFHAAPTVPLGTTVTAMRPGGLIILPSGKLLFRGCPQEVMPRPGHQYAFVMAYLSDLHTFLILRAYELDGNYVYELDTADPIASAPSPLVLHRHSLPTTDFLTQLRQVTQ